MKCDRGSEVCRKPIGYQMAGIFSRAFKAVYAGCIGVYRDIEVV